MLHRIGPRSDRPDGVVVRLSECHTRIRRFSALAARLADAGPASDAEIAEAARAVISYFDLALPLHAADEDESIAPRLGPAQASVLAEMAAQHQRIEWLLDELIPRWRRLATTPADRDADRSQLSDGAARLDAIFDAHLALEEAHVFPAIELLPADVQEQILDEMTARRRPTRD